MQNKKEILRHLPSSVKVCAVTKGRGIKEIEALLKDLPQIKCIGENRWPDCEEKFMHFSRLERHFIGPLQSNKVGKVVKISDVIQSVDSLKLLEKINKSAEDLNKVMEFCIQVNISEDEAKSGISPSELPRFIEKYLEKNPKSVKLTGLMTIGSQSGTKDRKIYFQKFKNLFDQINTKYFPASPLKILSMGMSADFETAIASGATMVRLGSCLF